MFFITEILYCFQFISKKIIVKKSEIFARINRGQARYWKTHSLGGQTCMNKEISKFSLDYSLD